MFVRTSYLLSAVSYYQEERLNYVFAKYSSKVGDKQWAQCDE